MCNIISLGRSSFLAHADFRHFPLICSNILTVKNLAAYLVQGISLEIPEPDRKGRVDMTKASLQFNPGPPPPLFEFGPSQFDPSVMGEGKAGGGARKGGRAASRVVWRGMRMFGQRAVLLACARNVGRCRMLATETKQMDFAAFIFVLLPAGRNSEVHEALTSWCFPLENDGVGVDFVGSRMISQRVLAG